MISIGGGTSCCGGETSISSIASAPLTCISNWSREKSKTDGCCEETQRGGIRGTSDDNYSVETTLVEGLQQSFGEPRFNDKIFCRIKNQVEFYVMVPKQTFPFHV